MGTNPFTAVSVLKSMGADMVGITVLCPNMEGIIESMFKAGGGYLSVKPTQVCRRYRQCRYVP